MNCKKCDYIWLYSGDRERATCPGCGHNNRTVEQQRGLYVDEKTKIDLTPYSHEVFLLLKRGIETGDEDYREGLKEVFPTL